MDMDHIRTTQPQPQTMMMEMPLKPVISVVSIPQEAEVIDFHNDLSRNLVFISFHNGNNYLWQIYANFVRMKRILHIISIICLCLSIGALNSHAQTRPSIDTDIHAIRNTAIPSFRYHYDDYLQYSPAILTVGLKACGYESRSGWGRMLFSDAVSAGTMAILVNGLKYTVARPRPDGSANNSFPSGHTATSFLTATMLYKEYGWRSPWFSIGGYTVATISGVSRILNNKHYMSDIAAGAVIGIGSVYLGYFLSDLIFKDRFISEEYLPTVLSYDGKSKHYVAEILFGRRFIIGAEGRKQMGELPVRGGLAGLQTDIPFLPGAGISARMSASSMIYESGHTGVLYSALAGPYWNLPFARILEFQVKAMAGYGWMDKEWSLAIPGGKGGVNLSAGVGLSLIIDNNFKLKTAADFESISLSPKAPWVNSAVVSWGASWFW